MEDYKVLRKVGSGNFAKVYLALHLPTQEQVALKVIDKDSLNSTKMKLRVEREIASMKKLKHDGIVEYFESFETPDEHVVVMEYLPCGELFEHIWQKQGLSEDSARKIFIKIVQAVDYCHKNSVVHRDLKLENILLDRDHNPKLIDFGFSKTHSVNDLSSTYCGSPLYASPEMVLGNPYSGPECDVWSLGVILYCMLTACMPFDDRDLGKFMKAVEKGAYVDPPRTSESVRNLISRMLDPCPETRATISEILLHPWLQMSKMQRLSVHTNITATRRRKMNIHYSKSQAVELAQMLSNCCQCEYCQMTAEQSESCSSSHQQNHSKDFVVMHPHCCMKSLPFVEGKDGMRTYSCASSGYGSQNGSALFTPSEPQESFSLQKEPSSSTSLSSTSTSVQKEIRTSAVSAAEELVFV